MKHLLLCFMLILAFDLIAQDPNPATNTPKPAAEKKEEAKPAEDPPRKPADGAVEEGGKIFEVVSIDMNSKVFSRDLPFDVPFIIEGSADTNFTKVTGSFIGGKNASILNTSADSAGWEILGTWEKTVLSTTDQFYLQSPELKHNQYYKYNFKYSKEIKPTAAELSTLRSELVKETKSILLSSCVIVDGCELSIEKLTDFQATLRAAAVGAFGNSVTVKPKSIFDNSAFDAQQVKSLFREVIDSATHLNEFSLDFDSSKPFAAANAYRKLKSLFSVASNQLMLDNIAGSNFAAEVTDDFKYFNKLNANGPGLNTEAILNNALRGLAELKVTVTDGVVNPKSIKPFTQTFNRNFWPPIQANYLLSQQYINKLRNFVVTLIDNEVERKKLKNYVSAAAANRQAVDNLNKTNLVTLNADLEVMLRHFASLGAKSQTFNNEAKHLERRLERLALDVSRIAIESITIEVNGTTSAEFKTRANWYVSADLGMCYMFGNYGLSPYIGTNIYLRPINKQSPLYGWMMDKRFSFLVALNLPFFGGTSTESQKLFNKNPSLLTGAGLRISHALRINGGIAMMKLDETIVTQRSIGWTPFCSISFDVNVGTVFNKLLPTTLQNSIQNTTKK